MEIWQMSLSKYLEVDETLMKARQALDQAYAALKKNDRWGDVRRFSGRSAGLRLERIDKARERISNAYDRAEVRHRKAVEQAIKNGIEVPNFNKSA